MTHEATIQYVIFSILLANDIQGVATASTMGKTVARGWRGGWSGKNGRRTVRGVSSGVMRRKATGDCGTCANINNYFSMFVPFNQNKPIIEGEESR